MDAERTARDVLEEWRAVERRLQADDMHADRAELEERAADLRSQYHRAFEATTRDDAARVS